MREGIWNNAVAAAPVPERAQQSLERWRTNAPELLAHLSEPQAKILCALWSGSEWAGELLIKQPQWLAALKPEALAFPRQAQGLRREMESWLAALLRTESYGEAFARIREFKNREMIRIAARDLARLGDTGQIIHEISDVADVCLDAVLRLCRQQLQRRFGTPFHQDASGAWHETRFCVLGMGKLGGQELNYSSDVDVLFVYSEEGNVFKETPRRGKATKAALANHQFFKRLAEAFVAEVGKAAPEGTLFRIDLRLRPEGESGPLARSLAGYENYYAQWGQTWERMMLIKARCVAGDAALAGEFLEMVQPFRYPRSVGESVLDEVAAMKQRIENEVVKTGELGRNVKLGRGGVREIEFIAQSLQLLHAGRNPFLQNAQTLPVLQKLVEYHLLSETDANGLARAYKFLRDVEHRLQMEHNRQTHTIPVSAAGREWLARVMGFESFTPFEAARAKLTEHVQTVYDRLFKSASSKAATSLPADFAASEAVWKTLLEQHSFRDVAHAFRLLKEFALGPGYGHVSTRTTELALQLITRILAFCPNRGKTEERRRAAPPESPKANRPSQILSDSDRVLARLDTFVAAYGARPTLYEMWSSHPPLFELMLFLFDRSEFLAEAAIRTPDMVDQLVLSGHLRRRKNAAEILGELRHGRGDADQKLWLRRYHQTELMRIGLRDILGLADHERNFEELSALADACLQYALEIAMRKLRLKSPPFAIIGWGKLGGAELNYGSDLDITFLARTGARDLPKLQRVAVDVMELLSSQTELGVAFETDARLRPDGEKGLLVNTLDAYEDYYRQRAQLWEIQSLSRTRFVAGDETVGAQFRQLAAALTDFRRGPHLAAWTPDWKREIARMRERIEKERTPSGKDHLAIKTGAGGLIDAEFIAQMLCLEHGWQEPNTLRALQRAAAEKTLRESDAEKLIDNYRRLRGVEAILRRWSFAGETVLPDDPAPRYRVAVRCGWANADEFMRALGTWRKAIREVYWKTMR